ncbi:MAG: tetratricopeptide repeat protein, partial [Gemmataceae bacterium]
MAGFADLAKQVDVWYTPDEVSSRVEQDRVRWASLRAVVVVVGFVSAIVVLRLGSIEIGSIEKGTQQCIWGAEETPGDAFLGLPLCKPRSVCYAEFILFPVRKVRAMTDLYGMCPCGSGKKFKWCCQAISASIQKVFELEEAGQHENALKAMEQVVQANASNPEVWGQKAKLLFLQGKPEEADETLQKAFAINPNYAYGLMLRGQMRFSEGEYKGALTMARRAAAAYHHEAHDSLAKLYFMIFDCEMRCNRPVAARAAIELVHHLMPSEEEPRQALEGLFGPESRLPLAARKAYSLRTAKANRRVAWDTALKDLPPKFSDLAAAYQKLVEQDPKDADAWYNLGLLRAWLGDNRSAIEALEVFIESTEDEAAAAEAATLGEVLRCGLDMEEACDYAHHVILVRLTDPQPLNTMLQEWVQSRRLIPLPSQEQNVLNAVVLELTKSGLVTVGNPGTEGGRFAAYLLISGPYLRLICPVEEIYQRLKEEVRSKLGLGLTDLQTSRIPASFPDILAEALLFPLGVGDEAPQIHLSQIYR